MVLKSRFDGGCFIFTKGDDKDFFCFKQSADFHRERMSKWSRPKIRNFKDPSYGLLPLLEWNIELEKSDSNFLSIDLPHIEKCNVAQDFDAHDGDNTEAEEF